MSNKIPLHVGLIMDGNGRWAKEKGLERSLGHKEGSNNLKELATYIYQCGIKYLSIYAFSTDNFKRSSNEVKFLMDLFIKVFKNDFDFLMRLGIKVVFSGRKEGLSNKVIESMNYITNKTFNNQNGVLNVCLNYGSCEEIIDACKKIINDNVSVDSINKESFYKYLYQDLPPLDLVIRTSGEYRLSNFMLYQASYAEFYFADKYFPDFKKEDFDKALIEYNKRKRRFGGVVNEKESD